MLARLFKHWMMLVLLPVPSEVVAVGPEVADLRVGRRVAVFRDTGRRPQGCYAQYNVMRAADLLEVPADLDVAEAGN